MFVFVDGSEGLAGVCSTSQVEDWIWHDFCVEAAWVAFVDECKRLFVDLKHDEFELEVARSPVRSVTGVVRDVLPFVELCTVNTNVEHEFSAETTWLQLHLSDLRLQILRNLGAGVIVDKAVALFDSGIAEDETLQYAADVRPLLLLELFVQLEPD